ncbi:protein of unknown function [endosymbiont DhMRE of Dentiscutata heterogama]|uniref:hypothetical protein n=1 Tax=endosymbiont DhMRE of Dentiscutata heterogama TaxID=1609546 RepID=UPI000629D7F2|nr:hypothetical protein [endosymbiont DhMRE of Dentiscutata heterogama]CFW93336.1 protein of unknown function [endosymbiont DhMRE of Dentiscutata heterogama]
MEAKLINKHSKEFLITRIRAMQWEGDQSGEVINDNQLSEMNWNDKLRSLISLYDILKYANKIANEILTIQGKELWKSGEFHFERPEQQQWFWLNNVEDQKDIIQTLENALQERDNHKQQNEQILTNLKNILGDDLTDWETKIAKKSEVDQASQEKIQQENQKKQLQQKLSELTDQLNNQDSGQQKEELEQQIKQLQAELEQANNRPQETPDDYQTIKNELEQLKKQTTKNPDSQLSQKVMEMCDKILARERERERERESKTNENLRNLPSNNQKLYWVIGIGGVVIIVLLVIIIRLLRFQRIKKRKLK